ncbi:spore germination protein (amino acid permease) [Thermolongibacillus altinsuensis]|uniref:Spore germination protein (Amino acid permease) n=1 Tax=Thermolongibacillus altinsuensis TaxID=575256 RepID=A0A4R1QDS1_9BACL|nr:GerAB/ArcD/ProY family transporter [Thermolongibacillus altinsuensis]TCL49199.1 spore germination protein (amino acid permease) [Thermolongibacillus altinsuensis]
MGIAKERTLLNVYLVMFLVHTSQIGLGIIGVQRVIFVEAKQDAWIAVIISGLLVHLIIWIICKTLQATEHDDIFSLHTFVYGKTIGAVMNLLFIAYLLLAYTSIALGYVEMVLTWMYPDFPLSGGVLILIVLTIYALYGGGIRLAAGVSFITFFLTIWIVVLMFAPLKYAEWIHLLPILEATPSQMARGVFKTTYTMLGFEILYVVYPFIKEKEKVLKFAQIGVFFTTFLITAATVFAIVFFSPKQLEVTIWASLSMFTIVKFSFIERFEYVLIPLWLLVIFPNLVLFMWAVTRGGKAVFHLKQKYGLFFFSALAFFIAISFAKRATINEFIDQVGYYGFGFSFVYPFFLYTFVKIKKRFRKR